MHEKWLLLSCVLGVFVFLGESLQIDSVTPSLVPEEGNTVITIQTLDALSPSASYQVSLMTGAIIRNLTALYVSSHSLNFVAPAAVAGAVGTTVVKLEVYESTGQRETALGGTYLYYGQNVSSSTVTPKVIGSSGGNNITIVNAGFSVPASDTAFIRLAQHVDMTGLFTDCSCSYVNSIFRCRVTSDLHALYEQDVRSVYLLVSINGNDLHPTNTQLTLKYTRPLRVLYVFPGYIDDYGVTHRSNLARLAVTEAFGPSVDTNFYLEGIKPINTTTQHELWGDMIQVLNRHPVDVVVRAVPGEDQLWIQFLAEHFPTVKYLFRGIPDLSTVWYLAGLMAGDVARQRHISDIGHILVSTRSVTMRRQFGDFFQTQVNAFTIGAKRANPNVTIHVLSVEGFSDPYSAAQAGRYFVDNGFKMLTFNLAAVDAAKVAVSNGLLVISAYSSVNKLLGSNVLTTVAQRMELVDVIQIQQLFDGDEDRPPWSFAEGAVGLASFSGLVSQSTRHRVAAESTRVAELDTRAFLCGPLKDQIGVIRVPSGSCVNSTSFILEGIVDHGLLPLSYPKHNTNLISRIIVKSIRILTIVGMAVGIFVAVLLFRHRSHKAVRYASVSFCVLMIFGNVAGLAANFMFTADEGSRSIEVLNANCKGLPWIIMLPTTVTLGCLFAKIWRVHKLFNNRQLRRRVITDAQVLSVVIAALIIPLILLIAAAVVSPMYWKRIITSTDIYGNPLESYGACHSDRFQPFIFLLLSFLVSLLCYGSFLVYKTRKVASSFNETHYIGLSMVSILQITVVLLPMNFLVSDQPRALCLIRSISNFLGNLLVLLVIFIPKLQAVYRSKPSALNTSFLNRALAGSVAQDHTPSDSGSGRRELQGRPPQVGQGDSTPQFDSRFPDLFVIASQGSRSVQTDSPSDSLQHQGAADSADIQGSMLIYRDLAFNDIPRTV